MSTITIAGNLTRDPELHNVNGGKTVARFSIAENRRWTDRSGTEQEAVTCRLTGKLPVAVPA